MDDCEISQPATVTVANYRDLRDVWEGWSFFERMIVGRIVVKRELTARQLARLPKELREKLEYRSDSLAFLKRLYDLEDPRK
jgi:hypothetical protein